MDILKKVEWSLTEKYSLSANYQPLITLNVFNMR